MIAEGEAPMKAATGEPGPRDNRSAHPKWWRHGPSAQPSTCFSPVIYRRTGSAASASAFRSERAGAAILPILAVQRVEQRHLLLARMGDHGGEALAGAARARLARNRHLLGARAIRRRRRHRRQGRELLVARRQIIVLRLAALHHPF